MPDSGTDIGVREVLYGGPSGPGLVHTVAQLGLTVAQQSVNQAKTDDHIDLLTNAQATSQTMHQQNTTRLDRLERLLLSIARWGGLGIATIVGRIIWTSFGSHLVTSYR